jgi:exportin-2 (importin alpha re-exporter)
MVTVPAILQAQLGDAISVIADSDFYHKWDTLVDDLVSRLTPDDIVTNNGVLKVAHSIFKKWEPLYRTDDLFTEINHVLSKFAQPFLQQWANEDKAIAANELNPKVLKEHLVTLDLIVKLLFDLSCQDIPPQFEDNLGRIAGLLHKYLAYDPEAAQTKDDDEPGLLEEIRADIFRVLILYTQKYEDAFGPHLGQFIGTTWTMLINTGIESKHDIVVARALEFLTTVVGIAAHTQTFNDPVVLSQVTEKVIVPNVSSRESDVDLLEDEPIEFIRRDLEGSGEGSRRRSATNFLKRLLERFEQEVTSVILYYVQNFLGEYAKNGQSNWKSKDIAIHLFFSIASKGTTTAARGVLNVNPNIDVVGFFLENIIEDLADRNTPVVLGVDAIKYLYTFRGILPTQQWQAAFPLLVQQLANPSYVVYTYAAVCIDRALYLTDEAGEPVIPHESIVLLAKDLLSHLFALITKDTKPEKVQENEFLMKCTMRILIVAREDVLPIAEFAVTNLVNITKVIRHNPSNPGFYYYLFESFGALIRFAGPVRPEELESFLFPVLMDILHDSVDEFTPYILQLYAAMVVTNPSPTLSANFQALVQPLLTPSTWDARGKIPASTRLLVNMIPKGSKQMLAANQVESILIIFQKLVRTKANESHAMDLIEAIVLSFPVPALENYWPPMLQLMFSRLSDSPTQNFKLRFVRFYHLVMGLVDRGLGADFFIAIADQVQIDVFTRIYITIILPETQKLSRPTDRKLATISLTRTIADSEAFMDRYAKRGWAFTCEALLELLISLPLPSKHADLIEDRDIEELGFGAVFTPLNTCKRSLPDMFPEVSNVKSWVKQFLQEADKKHGGRVMQYVWSKLSSDGITAMQNLMAE